jgi:hypothetical protein
VNNSKLECSPAWADLIATAQRELGAFIRAVTELFGSEQARLSAADWLDEFERESLPGTTSRDWRAVTTAAAQRLASRQAVALSHRGPVSLPKSYEDPTEAVGL